MVETELERLKALQAGAESSDDDVGPRPLPSLARAPVSGGDAKSGKQYGEALLPGEGAGIAAFVQNNLRCLAEAEIGIDSDNIARLEQDGYVMSGSRHAKMNAVRLRKENQVYTMEEKRALAIIALEERQKKEVEVVNEFKDELLKAAQRHIIIV